MHPESLDRRVWIADDSPLEAQHVARLLAPRFTVEVFADGPSLIERASGVPPAVVVLDWQMPGMSGLEVCRFLRTQPSTAEVGILVVTSRFPRRSDMLEALAAGANEYLVKPLGGDALVARVEALFRVQESRRRAGDPGATMRMLLEQHPDAVVAFDEAGRLAYANAEAERLFAWDRGAPLGQLLAEVLPDTHFERRSDTTDTVTIGARHFLPAIRQVSVAGAAPLVTVSLRDFTDVVRAEEERTVQRERATEAERRARDRLRSFVMQAPAAIAVLRGSDHVFELANDRYLELVGRGVEIVGRPGREALPELIEQGVWDILDRARATRNPHVDRELSLRVGPTGDERFVNWTVQPIRDAGGGFDALMLFAVDVTEQVRARQHVERLAGERNAVLAHIREGVVFTDAKGTIVFSNDAATALYGTPIDGLGVREHAERFGLFTVEGLPYPAEQVPLARALRGEQVVEAEWMIRRSDGTFLIVQGSASPVVAERGRTLGAVLTLRDVTERRRLERTLRLSEERYRSLMDATAQIIWTNTADGLMSGAQPSWAAFTGQRFDEYQGYAWSDVVHPDDRALTIALWRQAVEMRSTFRCEHRVRRHDGAYRDFSVRAVPVCERDGTVREWVGVHTDITDRKRAEADRVQLLERERRARSDAEAASRTKDEFLAMLGHELRNPLAPILTALQVMKLRGHSGSEHEQEIIERQLRHVVRLVDDLLDVSRVTQGKIELKKQSLELAQVVLKAIEMARPILEQRSHNLTVKVAQSGLVVDADPVRLAQVLANLLTNAAKYTERGGTITLTAAREGNSVVTCVRDTGIGISPEMLPRVFDMFVQSERSIERSQGGLGLGLTIVRSLVELHGGAVAARSEGLGHGCEFEVRLPASRVVVPVPAQREAAAPERRVAVLPSARILVVDDNVDAAELLSTALDGIGYATVVAHDGPSALDVARDFHPDVALLDIGLPVMDGYELARQLRGQANLSQVKLVAVTGYGQESDRARTRSAGFDGHLVKPVDFEHLRAVVADLLDGARRLSAPSP